MDSLLSELIKVLTENRVMEAYEQVRFQIGRVTIDNSFDLTY